MRESLARLARWLTIGALCLLSGCSAIRLGYDQGPTLAWWWIDGYADFNSEQASRVKDALYRWFAWHRSTQLVEYAGWLAALEGKVGESITPAQVCRWSDEARALVRPAIDRGLAEAAPLIPALTEAQFRHIEARNAKANDEFRRDFLQPKFEDRFEAAMKRTLDRAETVYGRLGEAQRKVIAAAVAESPFDPEGWLVDRQRRQRDTVQTLRKLAAERADSAKALSELKALAERTEHSPVPAYRAYQQRLTEHNCGLIARLHNSATPVQRQAARERLKGWESDLRLLAAAAPG